MLFHSTNRFISQNYQTVSFKEAFLKGLAEDEGLYMPTEIPFFGKNKIKSFQHFSYPELALEVLYPFVEKDIPADIFKKMLSDAYNFAIPIEKVNEFTYIARLDQGPTASFKDFAARIMARMMRFFLPPHQQITILVATSGDTGSAVGEAFRGIEGVKVYILYPEKEVSPIQKKQLDSIGENVQALSVNGKFDDCQRLVKQAFTDKSLQFLHLTSANSINIGRVLPQIVYYFYIFLQVVQKDEPIIFCVPSGNLGNSLGAEIARRMGLPVEKLLIATNENKSFPHFLESGSYSKIEPSINSLSNAMNVGNPSNLARYFDLYEGTVDKNGHVHRFPNIEAMRTFLEGFYITDIETIQVMQEVYHQVGILVEPHGAVGMKAIEKFRMKNPHHTQTTMVCIETAHPAKFPEIIEQVLRFSPEPSEALKALSDKDGNAIPISAHYEDLRDFLLSAK